MKTKKSKNLGKPFAASVAAMSLFAVVGEASAEIPGAVVTALATAASDVASLGGNVLLVFVAIAAFKYLRKGF